MEPQTWSVLFFGVVCLAVPIALVGAEVIRQHYRDQVVEEASTIGRWTLESAPSPDAQTLMAPVRLRVWDAAWSEQTTWSAFLSQDAGSIAVLPTAIGGGGAETELDSDTSVAGDGTNQAALRLEVGRRRAQANAVVHLGAGGAAGAVFAAAVVISQRESGLNPLAIMVLWLAMCLPVLPVVAGIVLPIARVRLAALVAFVLVAALAVIPPGSILHGSFVILASTLIVPTFAAPAMVVTRWRTTAPALLLVAAVLLSGLVLPIGFLASLGSIFRLTDDGVVSLSIVICGAGVAVAGWFALKRLERSHVDRRLSDQLLLIDAWWLFVTIGHLASGPAIVAIGAPLAFAAYWFASRFGYSVASGIVPTPDPRRLLVLRVPGVIDRGGRLLRSLDRLWRPIGSIEVMSRPGRSDMAAETLEPGELLVLLSDTLRERFVKDADEFEDSTAEPTLDGRYGVREHFCDGAARSAVVSRLLRRADAVVLDLRGLDAESAEHREEMTLLVHRVPLGLVLVVVDASTDRHIIVETIETARRHAPADGPNLDGGTIDVLNIGLATEIPEEPLLAALLERTATPQPRRRSPEQRFRPPSDPVPEEPPPSAEPPARIYRPTQSVAPLREAPAEESRITPPVAAQREPSAEQDPPIPRTLPEQPPARRRARVRRPPKRPPSQERDS